MGWERIGASATEAAIIERSVPVLRNLAHCTSSMLSTGSAHRS